MKYLPASSIGTGLRAEYYGESLEETRVDRLADDITANLGNAEIIGFKLFENTSLNVD